MATVFWTVDARDDLQSVHAYIAEDAPERAESFIEEIIDSTNRLAEFPLIGRSVPEFNVPWLRQLVHGNYRILYEPRGVDVWILAVIHGARDIASMSDRRNWRR